MDLEPYNIGDIVLYDLSRYAAVDVLPIPVVIVGFYIGHIIAVPQNQAMWPWPFFHTWPRRQLLEPWYIVDVIQSAFSPATPNFSSSTTRTIDDQDESEDGDDSEGW